MAFRRSLGRVLHLSLAVLFCLGLIVEAATAHGPGRPCCGPRPPPRPGPGPVPGARPPMMPPNMMQGLPPGVREAIRNALGANRPGGRYAEIRQGHFVTESAVETYVKTDSADKVTKDAVTEFYAETAGQVAGQTPYVGPVAGPAVKYVTKQNLGPLMDYEFRVDPSNVDWSAGQERFGLGGGPAGWRGPIK